jgi:hypothetical protein
MEYAGMVIKAIKANASYCNRYFRHHDVLSGILDVNRLHPGFSETVMPLPVFPATGRLLIES